MGKKALGKGLKDLLPQEKGDSDKKSPKNMEAQKKKVELQKVVDEYREKGYIVTKLSKSLKKDIPAMEKAEKEFMEGLKKLEKVEEGLAQIDLTGFEKESKIIENKRKDPLSADELLKIISGLEGKIIDKKDVEYKEKEEKMDAWIQGQKKVMIDLMGIYKERATQDGADVQGEAGQGAEEIPVDGEQAELRAKLEEWKGKGYLVTRLESILLDDLNQAKEEFAAFEQNIEKINKLNARLENLNTEGYEAKVRLIKTKLNYPNLANEVEKEIIKLETKILGAPTEEATPEEEPPAAEEAPEAEVQEEEEAAGAEVPETGEGEVTPEAGEGELPSETGEGEGMFNPEEIMAQQQTEEGEEQPQEESPQEEQPREESPQEEQPQEETPREGQTRDEGSGDLFDPEAILREMEGGEGKAPTQEEGPPQEQTPPESSGEEASQETPGEGESAESQGEQESPEEPATPTPDYGDPPEALPQLLEEAQAAYRDRDFKKAVEYFDRVLALDPDNSNAIFMRKRAASKL